ncbi:hypothetical protein MNBD_ALPHA04-2034 [hydrothermal vent metagenome]|uniref:Uncharacterized protein n=1 Tax=hydrothermal vent metagenome TaxID=652676 RepID=A0A3B0T6S2_9ZZZZ
MVAAASRKSVTESRRHRDVVVKNGIHWDKRMSNNCAFALLTYTLLQIFFVMGAIETKGMSIAPYFGLVVLVAIIIPFCRKYEQRWQKMEGRGLSEQSLAAKFRRDQVVLWILALGLPFMFVAIFKTIGSML